MIERFNFYDVYGFFIPGAFLIALLYLPHVLVGGPLPEGDLSAALIAIVAAYVVGHVLQIVAQKVLPSSDRVGQEYRPPSDQLLDAKVSRFLPQFREELRTMIIARFGIDVALPENRETAFFLCRNSVITAKTSSYVEQFEGMYTLMRGISAAAAVGCAYVLGWLAGPFFPADVRIVYGVLAAAGAFVLFQFRLAFKAKERATRIAFGASFLLAVFCVGMIVSMGVNGVTGRVGALLASAALAFLAAVWAHGSYHMFTWSWAQTVYRDFYLSQPVPKRQRPETSRDERSDPPQHLPRYREPRHASRSCLQSLCPR